MENAQVEREERVTPLELFFDLVFVFAITQVTALLAADPNWDGLGRGLLVLGALWWAWVAYAWLTNTLDPDEVPVRLAMFGAMGAMLVVSLAVADAFGDDGVLFGVAYLLVRVLHLVLYALAARGDPDLTGAVLRLAPTATLGPALIILAGFTDGAPQAALWIVALTLDYAGPALFGRGRGWRVSPAHFAERHALIVIIALGESVVAIGFGAAGLALDVGRVTAALLGIVVVAGLWWAYFDVVAIVAERKLTEAQGVERATLARDTYSYIHVLMVAGIVLFSLGLKKTIGDVDASLHTVPAFALCVGPALYLLAHDAMRFRTSRTLNRRRLLAIGVLLALIPAAHELPALSALAAVAAVFVVLNGYEAIHNRETRHRIRGA